MKYISPLFVFILFSANCIAQNLVNNPSFEERQAIDCLYCDIFNEEFSAKMRPWTNLNSHTYICDCNYKRKRYETDYKHGGICPFDEMNAKDGCAMIQMKYDPQCMDWNHDTRGCGSRLGTILKENCLLYTSPSPRDRG